MEQEKSESIKSLIESIDKQSVALPEFQRDFVWEIAKTYDLFDSIVRDIFIGAIIYGKPSFEIAVRAIDNLPRKSQRKIPVLKLSQDEIKQKVQLDNYRIILDGQQRSTSLYRALKGIDDVWFIAKNESDYEAHEQDIADKPFNEKKLEEILYEFMGEEDKERLSVKLSDIYIAMQENPRESKIKEKFFDKQYFKGFDATDYDSFFEKYLIILDKMQDILKESKLLSYYLLDMSIDKFALFFERSNSKGISLNFTDILAAKLYAGDFNLREKIEAFEDENTNLKDDFNRELIIRTIAYIVGDGKDKIDRGFILKKLNYEHFNEYWDKVCEWYKQTLNFLFDNHFIISQSWMPYEPMLIPLIIFRKEINKDFSQMSYEQSTFIHYWYWASIFSQRYTGASNEAIIKDANMLRQIAKNEKISEKAYFNRLAKLIITKPEDIFDYNRKGNAIYQGILNFIHYQAKGLIGWENTNRLNFNDSKLEDHHIFPINFIKKRFKNDQEALDKIESVANKTLIPKISNIKISDKSPSTYLNELKTRNPQLDISLINHLIPSELLDSTFDDYYSVILDERANKIFASIEQNIIKKQSEILTMFYKEPIVSQSSNIKIFARYYNSEVEAVFNRDTQKVLYNNEAYDTPSSAAVKAKEDVSGKKTTANGWDFWKYLDENQEERYLKEIRK
ncbi:MAG: DUF262 domain-containing protein [Microscillaceae bacterium]|jgi:hypothetical protein|nr:DUF262 domain-containing protein [Microscillaceae bacterium]